MLEDRQSDLSREVSQEAVLEEVLVVGGAQRMRRSRWPFSPPSTRARGRRNCSSKRAHGAQYKEEEWRVVNCLRGQR